MMFVNCAAAAARALRTLLFLLLSPFGYVRELVSLAGVLAALLGAWTFIAPVLKLDDGNRHAASPRKRTCISQLAHSPQTGTICLLRDYQELLAIDDLNSRERFCQLISPTEPTSLACGSEGWSLVTYSRESGLRWRTSLWGTLEIPWDDRQTVVNVAVAADGRVAAIISQSDRVELFQLTDDGEVQPFGTCPLTEVQAIWLSPSGRRLAAKTRSGVLRFVNVEDGRETRPLRRLHDLVMCAAWSGEGGRFAVGLSDGAILLCDAGGDGSTDRTIMVDRSPAAVALNADGEWLITGSSLGRIEAFRDGELVWIRQGSVRMISALAISQAVAAEQLISSATDGKIFIRSLTTGEMQRELNLNP